jgi:sialic acid synthase SpsE
MIDLCAEIGINFLGSEELCEALILEAKLSGATLVKFQLYDPEKVFENDAIDFNQKNILINEAKKTQISKGLFDKILKWCKEYQIEPFFSVFDEERFQWCEDVKIKRYKLASRSLRDTPEFCEKVIQTSKPIYASCGLIDFKQMNNFDYFNVHFLYCISKYPALFVDYKDQPKNYASSKFYGLSDHTGSINISIVAISRGAQFIEHHFTLSKKIHGSDHLSSILPNDLKKLKKFIKFYECYQQML